MFNKYISNLRKYLYQNSIIPTLESDLELIQGYEKYEMLILKNESEDSVTYEDNSDEEMVKSFKEWFFNDKNIFILTYTDNDKSLIFQNGHQLFNYLIKNWNQDCMYIYSKDYKKIVLFHHEKAYWKNF